MNLMEPLWYLTKDGDASCLELYERHYSCYRYRDGRRRGEQQEQEAVAIVARTLLAERLSATERAAKIAEDWPMFPFAQQIAAAIRSQP